MDEPLWRKNARAMLGTTSAPADSPSTGGYRERAAAMLKGESVEESAPTQSFDPQSLASFTGDFSPIQTRPPTLRYFNPPTPEAQPLNPEQQADYQRLSTLRQLGQTDPEAQRRFERRNDPAGGLSLSVPQRLALDAARMAVPQNLGIASRIGLATGDDPNRQLFGVGPTLADLADTTWMGDLSRANPSNSGVETALRGGALGAGFLGGAGASPGGILANFGSNAAAGAGLGYLGKTAAGLGGFMAPEEFTEFAEGKKTLRQASLGTALAGPRFASELPHMIGQTVEQASQGDTLGAVETALPAALLVAPHILGRAKKGAVNEIQTEAQGQRQGQGQQERLLSREATPPTTKAPVAAEGTAAPESVIVKRVEKAVGEMEKAAPVYEGVAEREGTYENIPPKTDAPLSFPREPSEKWSSPILKRTGASFYAEPLIDRVERQAGEEGARVGKEARDIAALASRIQGPIDTHLQKTVGKLFGKTPTKAIIGLVPGTEANARAKARAELSQPESFDQFGLGVARSREILEGQRAPKTPIESYYYKEGRKVLDAQWAISRKAGVETIGRPMGGGGDPSRILEGLRKQRAPRVMLPEFFQLARENGPIYQKIVEGIAAKNKLPIPEVRAILEEMRSPRAERTIAVEVARKLNWMPTHAKDGNRVIELMVSDPKDYLEAATRHVADRIAFIYKRGQTTKGQHVGDFGEKVNADRQAFVQATGKEADYDALMHVENARSLNILGETGQRAGGEATSSTSVGSKAANVIKQSAYSADRITKSLMLSRAFVGNIPEQLGSLGSLVRVGDIARGVRDLFPDRYDKTTTEMMKTGTINRQPIDLHFRSGRKVSDFGKHASEVIGIPLRLANETQESVNGAAMRAMATRLKEKGGDSFDHNFIKTLKFTEPEAQALLNRTADPSLYTELQRRGTAKIGGTTLRRSEKSKFGNSPMLQKIFSFQNYATTQAYLLDRVLGRMAEASRSGDPKQVVSSIRQAGNFMFGKALTGRTTKLLLAATAGYAVTRSDEKWYEQIGNDLLTAFGGAPQQLATETATSDKPMMEIATRASPLASQAFNLIDAIRGVGRYEGKDFLTEGLPQYLKSITTASKMQRGFAVLVGLSDPMMNSAVSKYYSWPDRPKFDGGIDTKESKELRQHVSAASELIRNGRFDEASGEMELIAKSLTKSEKPMRDARNKISARKLIQGKSEEAINSLKKHLGSEYYDVLVAHDALIDQFVWKSTDASRFFAAKSELNRKKNASGLTRGEAKALATLNEANREIKEYKLKQDRVPSKESKAAIQKKIDNKFEKALRKYELRLSQESKP